MYNEVNNQKNSLETIQTIYQKYPDDYRLAVPYAKALYRSLEFDDCLKVLARTDVLPYEGAGEARRIYNQAHLMAAIKDLESNALFAALIHLDKSRLWPENLGAGKPYEVDERLEDYLEMFIRNRLDQKDLAKECLTRIIDQTEKFQSETRSKSTDERPGA